MRLTRSHAVLLAASVVGAGALHAADEPGAYYWTAVAASGAVEAARVADPGWRAVQRGDELPARTVVRTGKRGQATFTRSASVLIVDPETRIELPEPSSASSESTVVQRSGSVVYEVDQRATPHFEVVTPHLIAGVKGTRFLVTVRPDRTTITVDRGLVEALDLDRGLRAEVGAGQSLFLDSRSGRFERIELEDGGTREVRREARRLAEMERREGGRRESEAAVTVAELGLGVADANGEHGDAGRDADMDCIKRGLDGHASVGIDDTGREDEAEQHKGGDHGAGDAGKGDAGKGDEDQGEPGGSDDADVHELDVPGGSGAGTGNKPIDP